jgi:glycine/D-amino acid oxidase-like deaminating enzyme
MDLFIGNTCWDKTIAESRGFGKLAEHIQTDILIVGGGISGSLCAFVLASIGMKVTVAEKNRIGSGSSAAQTGLLMYKSDKMLSELICEIGEERAVKFYRMCLEAMEELSSISSKLDEEAGYRQRDSIYYASSAADVEKLKREYACLSKHGFPAEYLSGQELEDRYGIDKAGAIRTWDDADINPVGFIRDITKKNIEAGVRYYENTGIELDKLEDGRAVTEDGWVIAFDHIVLATGYSVIYPVIKGKCSITRTYAFCSEAISGKLWKDEAMVWETKTPYLYFRSTEDRRIVGGGKDEDIDSLEEDRDKIHAKAEEIAEEIEGVLPWLDIKVSHAWNAIFATSKDGIPFIGQDPSKPSKYYLLGYEGNGTCYSMAGALIIKDLILGKGNPYADIVKVDR